MTTVVVDIKNKVMLSDSLINASPCFFGEKIFTAKDGTLIGISGELESCLKFKEWYINRKLKKDKPIFVSESFYALTLNESGCHLWASELVPMIVKGEYHAIGSGSSYALAVLASGLSAERAIEISIQLDKDSGGEINIKRYIKRRK